MSKRAQAYHLVFREDAVEGLRARLRWLNVGCGLLGLASFLLYHGQVLPQEHTNAVVLVQGLCLAGLLLETFGVWSVTRKLALAWRHSSVDSTALLLGAALALGLLVISPLGSAALDWPSVLSGLWFVLQGGLVVFGIVRLLRLFSLLARLVDSPLQVFMASFVGLILFGALLLTLPGATHQEGSMGFLNALFLATSATCVTGLSTMDVGRELTMYGQLVLLCLIQIGGLGIMTFAAFFSQAYGSGMSVRDSVAMGEVLNVSFVGRVGRMIGFILGITLVCELAGAAMLHGHWVDPAGQPLPAGDQIYYSVFHSVSAFCNAGFALHGDNLIRYQGSWRVLGSISALVVAGGIGFTVLIDVITFRFWALPSFRKVGFLRRRLAQEPIPRLTLQTKVVLLTTLALTLLSAGVYWALESRHSLASLDASSQGASILLHAVTPRTAGFNSLDVASMAPATNFFTIVMMLIGASPGGTGGGLKTTTIVVLALAVLAMLRGRAPEIFKRRLTDELTRKALVMLVLVLSVIGLATFLLMLTEAHAPHGSQAGFEALLFEVVSAFCTVGLTMNLTPQLTDPGRVIIIACMFIGRVGPLTLVLALGRRQTARYSYPTEQVMIG